MELINQSILIISPEPWDHIFVSKHHYAVHLARRGNKVFFLEPPSREKLVLETKYHNVYVVKYRGFPKGLRFYPGFLQRRIMFNVYQQLERLCSCRFDVVWSFDNSVFFDFNALPSSTLKICHIVDLNQHFQTKKAAASADLCICTSALIKERLSLYNRNVFKVTHGFNPSVSAKATDQPRLYGNVKAIYAGNLGMPYIDWMLLYTVVQENTEVDFYFIGPLDETSDKSQNKEARTKVRRAANCHFIGKVESDLLQSYYQDAEILLIAYQEKYHADQANPHKMMEYLGSGKMILATYTAEYSDLAAQGKLLMSKSNEEYPLLFKRALEELASWNQSSLQDFRKGMAIENSYTKQIERIEQIVRI